MKNVEPASKSKDCLAREVTSAEVVSASDLARSFNEVSRRVVFGGERIEIRRDGKAIAALVPLSDLRALETLEDRLDALDALDALADYEVNGGISLEDWKAKAGL